MGNLLFPPPPPPFNIPFSLSLSLSLFCGLFSVHLFSFLSTVSIYSLSVCQDVCLLAPMLLDFDDCWGVGRVAKLTLDTPGSTNWQERIRSLWPWPTRGWGRGGGGAPALLSVCCQRWCHSWRMLKEWMAFVHNIYFVRQNRKSLTLSTPATVIVYATAERDPGWGWIEDS